MNYTEKIRPQAKLRLEARKKMIIKSQISVYCLIVGHTIFITGRFRHTYVCAPYFFFHTLRILHHSEILPNFPLIINDEDWLSGFFISE